jgi:squalene-hopene/tetraprenyl-beta-curcumene cyclase
MHSRNNVFIVTFLCSSLFCAIASAQTEKPPATWSPKAAAAYLDGRSSWWMAWPKAARDHGTFCVSCHTLAPYAIGRPALRTALGETAPSANESKMLDNITHRVRIWKEAEPFYADQTSGLPKSSESRGTEAIFNALILVWRDKASGHLSPDARLALDNMWALQLRSGEMSGSWAWLQFHNAPWEGDSQFYGTVLAAIAVGTAPDDYKSEAGIQNGIKLMRGWLQKEMTSQTPLDRAALLWASAKLTGLLSEAQQKTLVEETLAKQQQDGGFSMSNLVGAWKRRDQTPIESKSDGYATGLVAYALEQVKAPEADSAVRRALVWLAANQNAEDGRWPASSLNKQRELASDAGRFMSDAATAYAVMALENAGTRLGQ